MLDKLKSPVVIIGAPRSGTSILGRILENHSDLVHLKEPRLIWKFGNDGKSDILSAKDVKPEIEQYIKKKFLNYLEENNGSRLLEKSPNNALRVPFVYKMFPDVKIIHIIRSGYESSLSIQRLWNDSVGKIHNSRKGAKKSVLYQRLSEMHWKQLPYYSGEFMKRLIPSNGKKPRSLWGVRLPGMQQMLNDLEQIEVCALQWKFCVELGCVEGRRLPKENYREYRLEKLDKDMVKDMLQFLNLDEEPGFFDYYDKAFSNKRTAWRKANANQEDIDLIQRWIEPTQKWLGYE